MDYFSKAVYDNINIRKFWEVFTEIKLNDVE